MKSLVNSINDAVTETLFGLSFAFPQLEYQASHRVVLMPKIKDRKHKVPLICGGRSGRFILAGILMVVPNYTGDCLNFGIAIEKARQRGLMVRMLFVIKTAGALAEQGLPLEEISKAAQDVLQNAATYAVELTACTIPDQYLPLRLSKRCLSKPISIDRHDLGSS
ncbi:Bifunctional ATP-dependent dihydroxyacetone kinase/FAD-AMP lyase (cyclizing) [Eufriesea mexicana]|uniref:Bifunctional ATP-dependent dihydroxyacetone kinase/FAD-AMP lyase (Cyclizing) n=1 Tax=Eufriesea mexicana TaxID=516756 RepID=A0A310SC66_9HYME|nr:Bifunctional ATP-dependent dihydroxyacetone kinase/FAD-AMP lyase (cyclizing) [Eufriesea mexicana]